MDRLSLKPYKQCEKNKNTDIPKVTDFKMIVTKQQRPGQYHHAALYVDNNTL
jgi:hypothetical protein